jgi:hypothetical protein
MNKKLLIVGCSHAAGSEIDGTNDSYYNRENSFGGQLAKMMDRTPINISVNGSTNSTIARSVLEWFETHYTSEDDVIVLISWTESTRMEIPLLDRETYFESNNPSIDWFPPTAKNYFHINLGWPGSERERDLVMSYHKFIANNIPYLEIFSANLVLQIQYFLKMKGIDYIMCNAMNMFSPCKPLNFYLDLIDKSRYYQFDKNDECFFWKYRNLGYTNPKAKYWHHNEIPHSLYAEKLYEFMTKKL